MGINVVINNFLPSYEQLNEIKYKSKKFEESKEISNLIKSGKNYFKNVEFNYLNRSTVLKNVNFVFRKK